MRSCTLLSKTFFLPASYLDGGYAVSGALPSSSPLPWTPEPGRLCYNASWQATKYFLMSSPASNASASSLLIILLECRHIERNNLGSALSLAQQATSHICYTWLYALQCMTIMLSLGGVCCGIICRGGHWRPFGQIMGI